MSNEKGITGLDNTTCTNPVVEPIGHPLDISESEIDRVNIMLGRGKEVEKEMEESTNSKQGDKELTPNKLNVLNTLSGVGALYLFLSALFFGAGIIHMVSGENDKVEMQIQEVLDSRDSIDTVHFGGKEYYTETNN